MNTKFKNLVALGYGVALLFTGTLDVSAFYNPNTGRWLNRDPIGERSEPNIYVAAGNDTINKIDRLGLLSDETLMFKSEWACMPCKCESVDVTYEPGGDSVDLGPYANWWDRKKCGSKVHVKWHVTGRPSKCKYFQDEQRTLGTISLTDGSGRVVASIAGVDGHGAAQEYTDEMGFIFAYYPKGNYKMEVIWNVTFRCVSSDGSVKTRHDSKTVSTIVSVPFW